jgi:hypothetical protein
MPNEDELRILAVAAIDGDGEYCLQRDWNKRWGAEYTDMKNLAVCGKTWKLKFFFSLEGDCFWCARSFQALLVV